MDKKQLLLDAAKAAGYLTESWHDSEAYIDGMLSRWNPLTSDADAFRLMVDCELNATQLNHCSIVLAVAGAVQEYYSDHNNDKHAATRMAIVRAAAQSQEQPQ